jgi:type III pantothenate kinase
MSNSASSLIAADLGNNRIKLGLFRAGAAGAALPEPDAWMAIVHAEPNLDQIAAWLSDRAPEPVAWWIGSVNRPTTTRLIDWLRAIRPGDGITLLAARDLPLAVALERPDMVGIDRLLDAVAVNRLRAPDRGAIIVDLGSAITVDLVSPGGAFLGGSIQPGIAMSARALHEFTDLLPWIDMKDLAAPPPALGTATEPAMRSGLFWGAVGGVRQLIERLSEGLEKAPQVFLSGGASPAVAELLGPDVCHVPHLTLAGIALTAASAEARAGY